MELNLTKLRVHADTQQTLSFALVIFVGKTENESAIIVYYYNRIITLSHAYQLSRCKLIRKI